MDGTTDLGNKEEIVAMVYCYKNEVAQEITSCTRYWSVHSPEKCDANGLLLCFGASLELLGIKSILDRDSVLGVDGMPVLIGASPDGASVNVAEHNGVRGHMQRALPWLIWSWCFSHRLELACKDSFVSATFLAVQEMLLRLYYLYEKSPKKSIELTTIVEELKGVFELGKGAGYLPIRCQGTR